MSETKTLAVRKLSLDTRNFRTVPQGDEIAAIHALIAIDTDWFWALMESLIETGYLPTENVIVLKEGRKHVVKEGNRRIAAMKIIHGLVDSDNFDLPSHLDERLAELPSSWKKQNANVPCTVYEAGEATTVDRIVALTHGKGEKAGRAVWKAIARARHNRDMANGSEPGLDLLEKFLAQTKKLTPDQKERWAGDYPISVLDEAIKRLAGRLDSKSAADLSKRYPKVPNRTALDEIVLDVGMKQVSFASIRAADFGTSYGLPPPADQTQPTKPDGTSPTSSPTWASAGSAAGGTAATSPANPTKRQPKAHPVEDPRAVMNTLKKFHPRGAHREKVATLLEEIKRLDLSKHPHAFCFLLRSMFEISAKAYCKDHKPAGGPSATKPDGSDRNLVDVLRDIVLHLTNNKKDKAMLRQLQGAMTHLASNDSILSVTSMNQLVHNPKFVITANDVAVMFGNIFPLLDEMNK